jgi:transcriptional regulator with XRE-family HTH domain
MSEVGREIKRMREGKGWSQAELAVYAGSSQPTVNQIESGKRNPSTATLVKLAKALDVEVADLFPKAQAPLSFEELAGAVDHQEDVAEQRREWFLQHAPSEEDRIMRIRKTVEIAAGYAGRWREERGRIEEEGTYPYGKSIEMTQLWEGFHEALNVDGTYPYMVWVLAENPEVSALEHEAWCNLDDALADMLIEIDAMRRVEAANKQRANDDAARGLEELGEVLGAHSTGRDELIG